MPTILRKSRKSSGATRKPRQTALDRGFEPRVWHSAAALAAAYRLLLEPDPRGGFAARALEMPTVFERGRSADACVRRTRTALTVAVATMLEMGQAPPQPAAEGLRHEQVNIRLTSAEKLVLDAAARRGGYRGLSDYLRAAGLKQSHQPG